MCKKLIEKVLDMCVEKLGNVNNYAVESEMRRFMIDVKVDPNTREQIMKKLESQMKPIFEAVAESRSWLEAIANHTPR